MTKRMTAIVTLILAVVLGVTSAIFAGVGLRSSRVGTTTAEKPSEDDVLTADKTVPELMGAIEEKERESRSEVTVHEDASAKTVSVTGGRYSFRVSYGSGFLIDSLVVDGKELLSEHDGICTSIKADGTAVDSGALSSPAEVSVGGTGGERTVEVRYSDGYADYVVTLTAKVACFGMKVERAMKRAATLQAQAMPRLQFQQDAIENIRWLESGSNFWVDGEGNDLKNFLSAEKFDSTLNIMRAMDEINFTLLSSFEDDVALDVTGVSSNDGVAPVSGREHARGRSTEVDRAPLTDGERGLRMNMVMAAPDANLEYATGDPVWGWNTGGGQKTGSIQPTGADTVFKPVELAEGDTSVMELTFTPADFEDSFDLGELYGVNEKLVSEALNSFARIMLLGKNVGSAQEFPNVYIELPALQMHWNTAMAATFGDDASMNTQKWALKNISTFLQKEDGHIRSPYPGIPGNNWGFNYPSMQTNYVTAIADYYGYTGDTAFAEDMRTAAERSLSYFHGAYFDEVANLVKNPIPLNPNDDRSLPYLYESHNDYWEKSVGTYNALLSVEYYEALVKLAALEKEVYKDADQAAVYLARAEKIKETFNKDKDQGGCFVPEMNAFYYGSANYNVSYLPVQATAIRTGIVSEERAEQLTRQIERIQSNFNMGFHVMNVRDLTDDTKPASQGSAMPTEMMVGENGGWYGAPDAEWYSAFVHIGDRGMIPYYINESMKKFEQTGFTGATTYKRDGVSPADDGWWECMPNMALPIWGLYTYGYGFQSSVEGLSIAPFISEGMVGSRVEYRWRSTDFEVTYRGLYDFVVAFDRALPVNVQFVNQTAAKSYEVSVNGAVRTVTADASGTVTVALDAGVNEVTLKNPDSEEKLEYTGENAFALNAVRPSSTMLDGLVTKYWAEQLTDGVKSGGEDGHWKPAASDKAPSITVVNGTRYVLSEIALYTSSGKYSFVIEGADDLSGSWKTVAEAKNASPKKEGVANVIAVKVNASFRYYRISFKNMSNADIMVYEVTAR